MEVIERGASTPTSGKGWKAFARQFAMDLRLWLWVILLLLVGRAILITSNRSSFADYLTFSDYLEVFLTGFRFDVPVATLIIFPSFLAGCLCNLFRWQRGTMILRSVMFYFVTISWVIITTITLGYFKQYHNQFDAHLLGVVYDDFGAIVKTIWQSYPVVTGLLVMTAISFALIWLGRKWISRPFPMRIPAAPRTIFHRVVTALFILCVVTLGLRGSWGRRPMQLKDAAQTKDFLINRCVLNPYRALHYAIKAHRELMNANGLDAYLKDESILAAFEEYAGRQNLTHVEEAFQRTAKGRPGEKPRHIFLILMESYDGWTMLEKHSSWNISNEMKALGKEGIYVQRFLPGSRSTMTSLATIIGGMGDAGVITNERFRPGEPPYSTAIAKQMQDLGYETHLYYAGYGGWHRIEDFAREQGFQHTHMGSSMDNGEETNEWGVSDKRFFSYIKDNFNDDKPTFNLFLTSSNHPPYTIDLEKENCPVTEVPPAYRDDFDSGNASLKMLGHHWYSDHHLGKFVRDVSAKHKGCLFAITGDHWGRAFPGPRPTFFEQAIVPLVLYGPGILPENINQSDLCGSHYDLDATLIELSAEAGHRYHSIGRNILQPGSDQKAISRLWILGKDVIVSMSKYEGGQKLNGDSTEVPTDFDPFKRQHALMHGISWWRIREGNTLPNE